ncbi:heme ABC transporter ATP-binding protein [uncultured Paracoccus sp.]|uniref:heme ABC transporter ATP-binding protein n=1 Tax=uncultured Paracoccus sp. TaxID=189685 RepID=UPI0032B16D0F
MSLTATGIEVRLGRATILRGIDMAARPGRITAIIGPNGSGKTTLMRSLTGELAPTTGRIVLNGTDISQASPARLAALRAVLPQQSALSFPFTVSEVVSIGFSAGLVVQKDRAALIHAALARVGLPDHAGRLYQQLSGGEQQRVQLARAMAQVWRPVAREGPRWLLLDEPVSSLDIAHQIRVMHAVRSYAAEGGGVVAVMHDLNLTAMFADEIVLMHRGRILASGAPTEVMTDDNLSAVYGIEISTNAAPAQGTWFLPQACADIVRP